MSNHGMSPFLLSEDAIQNAIMDSASKLVSNNNRMMRDIARKATKPYQDRIKVLEKENADLRSMLTKSSAPRKQDRSASNRKQLDTTEALKVAKEKPWSATSTNFKRLNLDSQEESDDDRRVTKRLDTTKLKVPNTTTNVDLQKNSAELYVYVVTAQWDDEITHTQHARIIGVYRSSTAAMGAVESYDKRHGSKRNAAIVEEGPQTERLMSFEEAWLQHKLLSSRNGRLDIQFTIGNPTASSPNFKVNISKHKVEGAAEMLPRGSAVYLSIYASLSQPSVDGVSGCEPTEVTLEICGLFVSRGEAIRACMKISMERTDDWAHKEHDSWTAEDDLLIVELTTALKDDGRSEGPRICYAEASNIIE
ncbi:MAG: hypothetical protein Q9160_005541 [Pyrenula sp. 1 TL-2023]